MKIFKGWRAGSIGTSKLGDTLKDSSLSVNGRDDEEHRRQMIFSWSGRRQGTENATALDVKRIMMGNDKVK